MTLAAAPRTLPDEAWDSWTPRQWLAWTGSAGGDAPTDVIDRMLREAASRLRTRPARTALLARLALRRSADAGDPRRFRDAALLVAKAWITVGRGRAALRALDHVRAVEARQDDPTLDLLEAHAWVTLERLAAARVAAGRVLASSASTTREHLLPARLLLADLDFRTGRSRASLGHHAWVAAHLPERTPPVTRAILCVNRANSLAARHRYRAAERQFDSALQLLGEQTAGHVGAGALYNRAYLDLLRGRYADALDGLLAAEDSYADHEDDSGVAHARLDRAEAHLRLHQPDLALECAAQAERDFAQLESPLLRGRALLLAARAALQSGRVERALRAFDVALRAFRASGAEPELRLASLETARCALAAGDLDAAEEHVRTAPPSVARPTRLERAAWCLLLARIDLARRRLEEAEARARDVLRSCRAVPDARVRAEALRVLAGALRARGRHRAALDALAEAVETYEETRRDVPPDGFMADYLGGVQDLYRDLVAGALAAGDVPSAFAWCERSRARALLDRLFAETDRRERDAYEDPRVAHVRAALNVEYQRALRPGAEATTAQQRRAWAQRIENLEASYTRLTLRRRAARRVERSPDSTPLTLEQVRAAMPADTVLVQYTQHAGDLLAFVVSRDGARAVPLHTAGHLESLLDRWQTHVDRAAGDTEVGVFPDPRPCFANLARLAAFVLEPLRPLLDRDRLVISPCGRLQEVPFHALPWNAGALCDAFDVRYAPSATAFLRPAPRVRPSRGGTAVFSLADEIAPAIAQETQGIAALHDDARLYIDEAATTTALLRELRSADTLHVATHGTFRRRRPQLSALRLADGWINLDDLERVRPACRLVVLAACESGVAALSAANDVQGVARAFLAAGTPALLASQWPVDDIATARFMLAFHTERASGASPSAALTVAMRAVRRTMPHPYFWAPFFLWERSAETPSNETDADRVERSRPVTPGPRERNPS